jgi:hypothetical protein
MTLIWATSCVEDEVPVAVHEEAVHTDGIDSVQVSKFGDKGFLFSGGYQFLRCKEARNDC